MPSSLHTPVATADAATASYLEHFDPTVVTVQHQHNLQPHSHPHPHLHQQQQHQIHHSHRFEPAPLHGHQHHQTQQYHQYYQPAWTEVAPLASDLRQVPFAHSAGMTPALIQTLGQQEIVTQSHTALGGHGAHAPVPSATNFGGTTHGNMLFMHAPLAPNGGGGAVAVTAGSSVTVVDAMRPAVAPGHGSFGSSSANLSAQEPAAEQHPSRAQVLGKRSSSAEVAATRKAPRIFDDDAPDGNTPRGGTASEDADAPPAAAANTTSDGGLSGHPSDPPAQPRDDEVRAEEGAPTPPAMSSDEGLAGQPRSPRAQPRDDELRIEDGALVPPAATSSDGGHPRSPPAQPCDEELGPATSNDGGLIGNSNGPSAQPRDMDARAEDGALAPHATS